ncbi:CopG family transcriptional regulator [Natroniella sulfidigena]|uniref:CopG family ribbon-helix-helix protein n=1 Tax=Natroniella sulfidigena TaxID=723921 RepID=UPI00200A0A5B|nr:CopG family transcriptional regulator [Natroniella sulfidigena]MCK8816141.1 CopG family transcriptional regulator [Natroniella sulfidigena]
MTNLKEVMVSLPNNLLNEVDGLINEEYQDRNEFISEAMEVYIEQLRKNRFRKEMKEGYLKMAQENLCLATESFLAENKTFFNYEARLAECD